VKAVDAPTIEEEDKLRRGLECYKIKASQFDTLREEIDQLKQLIESE
jgi:hypothetical protein